MPTYLIEILERHQLDMVMETLNGVFFYDGTSCPG